jgi:triphosphoribosyl-dephospho-CoA synthase
MCNMNMNAVNRSLHQKIVGYSTANLNLIVSLVSRFAIRSLYTEIALYPKPGLVSMVDPGSHEDMDCRTFMHSLFALRNYFVKITRAGYFDGDFTSLAALGIEAEQKMLIATGGVNTHRGAIFSLGLLCAAAGRLAHSNSGGLLGCTPGRFEPQALQETLLTCWGPALLIHSQQRPAHANGTQVARAYGVGGARVEAAAGLPAVFKIGLPTLRRTLQAGRGWECACIDVFFALLANVPDTNIFHRTGISGAAVARAHALNFMQRGGTADVNWRMTALTTHRYFVTHRMSPGGIADLLAASILLFQLVDGATEMNRYKSSKKIKIVLAEGCRS